MVKPRIKLTVIAIVMLAVSACGRKTVYDWGNYNPALARMYSGDPNYIVSNDIEILATEIAKTPPGQVPPGKAAHIGFLYSLQNQKTQAIEYFELEKKLFPESSILMNRLIQNAKR